MTLLPCPFCEGAAYKTYDDDKRPAVACKECNALVWGYTFADTIEGWNRRPTKENK